MLEQGAVTQLLMNWREGDRDAREQLFTRLYDDLRGMAARIMARENPGHTLQATALVHEAYGRIFETDVDWQDRVHFLAVVAQVMRRILVDHARGRARDKRGGAAVHVSLDDIGTIAADADAEFLELDDALRLLGAHDSRKEQIVELHYFAGLTHPEIATVLSISPATVDRDLRMARAWLKTALDGGAVLN